MAIDNTVNRSRLRSSLFRWMVKRHDELVAKWSEDGKVDWRAACEEFVELGLADLTGKAASERTARQTWFRVRKHVTAVRAKQATLGPRRINPSRLPKDWAPANAPPAISNATQVASAPGFQNQPAPIRTSEAQDDEYDPEEQMAHLRRTIRERSGR